jgi:hypothetical protein
MLKFRIFTLIILAFLLPVVLTSLKPRSLNRSDDIGEDPRSDTSQIIISKHIRRKYPCLYNLLQEMIAKNDSVKLIDGLNIFNGTHKNRLYIEDKVMSLEKGGETTEGPIDDKLGIFTSTITLNSHYFKKASRDYLVSVVTHEFGHVYLHWSFFCFLNHVQNVDTTYLKKHFAHRWNFVASGDIFCNENDHELMAEQYVAEMRQFILLFTNHQTRSSLQDSIALSFAFGGLHGTGKWREQGEKRCFMESVDGWARNMVDAVDTSRFIDGECQTSKPFLDSLHLISCQ